MNFRNFQYILKVAQLGNITKAAEELYMTQPALSRFIAKVEEEEGFKIFDRSTNPITLTYAGERYVATIRRIIELSDQFQEELLDISSHKKGKLTIGIPPARAASLLPRVLPEYFRRYPNVEVQTVESNFRRLTDAVRKGQVDFAVLPHLEGLEEFRCLDLFEDELILVTQKDALPPSASDPGEDGCRVIRLAELKDYPFILTTNGHGIRNAVNVLFEYHGMTPKILMETTHNEVAFGLAAAGMGAAIVSRMIMAPLQPLQPVDVYCLSQPGLKWTMCAIFNAENFERYFAAKCVELIREVYRSDGRSAMVDSNL